MPFPVSLPHRKLTSQLKIAGGLLAIVPLCLMMAAVVPAHGQTLGDASHTKASAASLTPGNGLGVNNVGGL